MSPVPSALSLDGYTRLLGFTRVSPQHEKCFVNSEIAEAFSLMALSSESRE
jgi:hypothetical protein